jgi:hypothetical protein
MSKIKRKQIDLRLTKGPANNDYGDFNSPGLSNGDNLEDAFDKLVTVVDKLAPPKPPVLSDTSIIFTLGNGAFKTARIAGTTTEVTNIFKGTVPGSYTPKFFTPGPIASPPEWTSPYPAYFFSGESGYLRIVGDVGEINISAGGTTVTTSTSKVIAIEDNKDYWEGVVGKRGFWKAIRASVTYPVLTPSANLINSVLEHSKLPNGVSPTGSKTLSFYVEKSAVGDNPNATNFKIAATTPFVHTSNRRISGVPTFATTDSVRFTWDMSQVAKFFYKANPISFTSTSDALVFPTWTWPSTPAPNSSQTGMTISANFATGKFVDNSVVSGGPLTATLTASDAIDNTDVESLVSIDYNRLRVDTLSSITNDARRVLSGSARFDVNFNTPYNHAEIIVNNSIAAYNRELQLEGGKYVYPKKDYTGYIPTGGLNYSGQTGTRWATWKVGTVKAVSDITIATPGLTKLLEDSVTGLIHFAVYVMVEGVTPWLNASKYYNATQSERAALSNTLVHDAPALDPATASTQSRKIFVTASGSTPDTNLNVYVRVVWSEQNINMALTDKPSIIATTGGSFNANA